MYQITSPLLEASGLDMNKWSDCRAMAPDTHHSRSLMQHCMYAASISIKVVCVLIYCTLINSAGTQVDSSCVKSGKPVTVS